MLDFMLLILIAIEHFIYLEEEATDDDDDADVDVAPEAVIWSRGLLSSSSREGMGDLILNENCFLFCSLSARSWRDELYKTYGLQLSSLRSRPGL